jgi:uncharacterized protein YbjT (DUF2867 family)
MRIAVAGGTGVVGRLVVAQLSAAGHDPVVLARSAGVDVITGAGLQEALTGAGTVIDVLNLNTSKRAESQEFFSTTTRNLLAAGERAGVSQHLALSIIGIDRVDLGYYYGKRRQEELVFDGPVPATVLRAAQFHEFVGSLLGMVPGPVAVLPRMRLQPVAAVEVAAALAALAVRPAAGMAPELAGPQPEWLADLARRLLRSQGSRRPVLALPVPGQAGRGWARGALLPTGDEPRGVMTFEQWLA